jgi:hypothetical protein
MNPIAMGAHGSKQVPYIFPKNGKTI